MAVHSGLTLTRSPRRTSSSPTSQSQLGPRVRSAQTHQTACPCRDIIRLLTTAVPERRARLAPVRRKVLSLSGRFGVATSSNPHDARGTCWCNQAIFVHEALGMELGFYWRLGCNECRAGPAASRQTRQTHARRIVTASGHRSDTAVVSDTRLTFALAHGRGL